MDKYKGSGAELVFGEGSFVGPKTIQVRLNNGGVRTLHGERVFLNLGTHAAIPDISRARLRLTNDQRRRLAEDLSSGFYAPTSAKQEKPEPLCS
jgi:pyruvate/2-oxoglutarate dehydrogenase complex dihydrolipoamide dehydrogenase (E3) component